MQRELLSVIADVSGSEGFHRFAVVYEPGDWGASFMLNMRGLAEELVFELVLAEAVQDGETDMKPLVEKLIGARADAVFVALYLNEAETFANQLYRYHYSGPVIGMGTGFTTPEWLEDVGSITGAYIMATSDYNLSFGIKNPESRLYYENYLATHDNHHLPIETGNGWLGMGTLADAVSRAGSSDREAIAAALQETDLDKDSPVLWFSLYEGVKFNTEGMPLPDGSVRYNQNEKLGPAEGQICVQVQDGRWQIVWPEEVKTSDIVFPRPKY